MELKLDKQDAEQVKKALDILKPIAEKNGCEVSELLEVESGDEEVADDGAGDDKVNLIVARLKSAGDRDKDYEG